MKETRFCSLSSSVSFVTPPPSFPGLSLIAPPRDKRRERHGSKRSERHGDKRRERHGDKRRETRSSRGRRSALRQVTPGRRPAVAAAPLDDEISRRRATWCLLVSASFHGDTPLPTPRRRLGVAACEGGGARGRGSPPAHKKPDARLPCDAGGAWVSQLARAAGGAPKGGSEGSALRERRAVALRRRPREGVGSFRPSGTPRGAKPGNVCDGTLHVHKHVWHTLLHFAASGCAFWGYFRVRTSHTHTHTHTYAIWQIWFFLHLRL